MDDQNPIPEVTTNDTQEQKKDSLIYVKLAANFFDKLIFFACYLLSLFLLHSLIEKSITNLVARTEIITLFACFTTFLIYLIVVVLATTSFGGSVGKLLFNLKIVDNSGNKAKFFSVLSREILEILPLILIFTIPVSIFTQSIMPFWFPWFLLLQILVLLAYIILEIYFDRRKRASLRDLISKTSILKTKPSSKFEKVSIYLFATLGLLFNVIIVIYLLITGVVFGVEYTRSFYASDSKLENDIGALATELMNYKQDHGYFPENINLLMPNYLKQIPEDRGIKYVYSISNDKSRASLIGKLHAQKGFWCWKYKTQAAKVLSEQECQP